MIDLRRQQSNLQMSPTIWMMTLELARLCGWKPAGTFRHGTSPAADTQETELNSALCWQSDYTTNDGQTVARDDALRLADAIDIAVTGADQVISAWESGRLKVPETLRTPQRGFKWFVSPAGQVHLQATADFCRQGEFQIF